MPTSGLIVGLTNKYMARCGLQLQEEKTELYSQRELTREELNGMKRAGVHLEKGFDTGFMLRHPSWKPRVPS